MYRTKHKNTRVMSMMFDHPFFLRTLDQTLDGFWLDGSEHVDIAVPDVIFFVHTRGRTLGPSRVWSVTSGVAPNF